MILKVITVFILPLVCSDQIVIHLRPEQILNTFQSVISSDYLRTLANDFVRKAAEHLISEMKNQEQHLAFDHRAPREENNNMDKKLVTKQHVLTLLSEPLPDGDNLEAEVGLSDEEGTKTKKETIVQGPMKINGAYYKRYFK